MAATLIEPAVLDFIRTNAHRWTHQSTIPDDVLDCLFAERLFKLFVPTSFGGRPTSLAHAAELYAALASADGSIGWLVQIGAGAGFFVPSFLPSIAEEIFAPERSVIAGSGYPTGTAYRVPGGYRVQGQWKYASGAQYASVFTANTRIADNGSIRAVAFRRDQVELVQDWDAFGMRATSSWTFRVRDVFVPEEWTFVVGEHRWNCQLPVYWVLFEIFARVSMGSVAFGLGNALFEESCALFANRPERLEHLESYRMAVSAAWKQFLGTIETIGDLPLSNEVAWSVNGAILNALELLRQTVLSALPYFGMQLVHERNRLSRIVRDFLVLWQHEMLRPTHDKMTSP